MHTLARVAAALIISAHPLPTASHSRLSDSEEPPSISSYRIVLSDFPVASPQALAGITEGISLADQQAAQEAAAPPVRPSKSSQNAPQASVIQKTYDLSAIQQIAYDLCQQAFGSGQYPYLANIVRVESGWRVNATEPTSGAYGLGQALPASKMAAYGSDYRTNPETQLRWLLAYIAGRYGTPEAAWSFHLSHGWY